MCSGASPRRMMRNSVLGRAATFASTAASAAAVWAGRSPMRWLALASTTARTMSGNGVRSSRCNDGLAMARSSTAAVNPRSHQPASPRHSATAMPSAQRPSAA